MDVMLHRHCARYIYVVPEGLRELMSDISREVLRNQPNNIYTFIADYLDALMITRENARVAARLVQYIIETSETVAELLSECGIDQNEAENAAKIIQQSFREFVEKKEPEKEDDTQLLERILEECDIPEHVADKAASVIQQAFRKFKERQEKEKQFLRGIIDWRVAARSTIQLYRKAGASPQEAAKAATLIKAAYKGYYTRQMMVKLAEQNAKEQSKADEGTGSTYSFSLYSDDSDSRMALGPDKSLSSESMQKNVRINYSGLKVHVDFGEPVVMNEEEDRQADRTSAKEILRLGGSAQKDLDQEKPPESKETVTSATEFIGELMEGIISGFGSGQSITSEKIIDQVAEKVADEIVAEEIVAEGTAPEEQLPLLEPAEVDAQPGDIKETSLIKIYDESETTLKAREEEGKTTDMESERTDLTATTSQTEVTEEPTTTDGETEDNTETGN